MLVAVLSPPVARTVAALRVDVLAVLAIFAALSAHLPFLESWPPAHNDEAREMNAFWVAAGVDPQARLMDPEFGRDPLYKGGLQGLTVGAMFRVAGLGLLQGRLVSLAWGGLLLGLVFLIGRRLYGSWAAWLALFFLALSRPFLVATHLVRPDIVLAAVLAAACYFGLCAVQAGGRIWHSLAAGVVLGLALDVHLNAVAFMPLVGLVFLSGLDRWWRHRATWLFVMGLGLGLVYYLLARIAPDVDQFVRSSGYWIGIDKRPPLLSGDLGAMFGSEIGRFQSYFTDDRRVELALFLAALLFAAVQSIRARRVDPLLFGLLGAFVLFVTLVSGKSEFYVVLFYPWLVLLLGGSLNSIASHLPRPAYRLVLTLAVALAPLAFGLADNYEDLETARSNFNERGYYALMDEVRSVVPVGSSILGPPLYWIGLHDHPYTDYFVWERLRAERRERFSTFAARVKPDLVVLDVKARHQVAINSPGFLESQGVLLTTIKHVGFDRVEVWKLS